MQDQQLLRQKSILVTRITIVIMMLFSFLCLYLLGAKIYWCLIAPFITVGLFYPLYLLMQNAKGWGEKKSKVWLGMPKLLIVIIYLPAGLKASVLGISITQIPATATFFLLLAQILVISMIINFFGSLIIWFLGMKQWMKYEK